MSLLDALPYRWLKMPLYVWAGCALEMAAAAAGLHCCCWSWALSLATLPFLPFFFRQKTWKKRKTREDMEFGRDEDIYGVLEICTILVNWSGYF